MTNFESRIRFGFSPSMLFPKSFEDPYMHFAAIQTCCHCAPYESFETFLPDDAANAMSIVAAADYSLVFRPGYEPEKESPEEWFEKLVRFFDADHVMIMKKTKKGEREMDLKPFVYELNVRKNGEVPALFMKVSAGSAANIKPELVLDAYYASLGEERPQFAFMTEREEVYADTATAEEAEAGTHKLVTHGDLGQDKE